MPAKENSMYKTNEPLLTALQRNDLEELRRKVNGEKGTYFDFYSVAKKYCNRYEDMMRSHGIRREE
ncbi:hypothetical protein NTE_01893 [Candidatus Nitrososphaera evergladensis SR1]|uniref:Uncharacterized protein n=1 Tax=Candidatus Nitrososphaera evergladensis SR1 TaxID=1459636 RepID=A0A075MT27_9ARCH|nr:hypothetical protein [Candidatus Nitrososphaera evergladensis]AIF83952.1 hypothetical protein NTE_01893 [Candidatus Nitrososphaera evergladensis SR1]